MLAEVTIAVAGPDQVGEAPAYDAAEDRLLWVDMFGGAVNELRHGNGRWERGTTWTLGRPVSSVIPRLDGGLLVASVTDFLALEEDGATQVFASLAVDGAYEAHLNDARCDPQGRVVAGWFAEAPGAGSGRRGAVVRLDGDGSIETVVSSVGFANGLDWSPDGGTFYLIDTAALCVDAFDYDGTAGRVANRRTVVTIERGEGAPDGMVVDSAGNLWVAVVFAGEVRCYSPSGALLDLIVTPCASPTSCAFAGRGGLDLFITSVGIELPATVGQAFGVNDERIAAAAEDQHGGALLSCRPGASGRPATPFAG